MSTISTGGSRCHGCLLPLMVGEIIHRDRDGSLYCVRCSVAFGLKPAGSVNRDARLRVKLDGEAKAWPRRSVLMRPAWHKRAWFSLRRFFARVFRR